MSSFSGAKKNLQFNREFLQLVGVLKGVAVSQFQALTRARKPFDIFLKSFDGFFQLIDLTSTENPFVRSRSETVGVVMVTSDEGFMGGLNAKVIHAALEAAGPGPRELIVIGARGAQRIRDMKLTCTDFPGVMHEKRYEAAVQIKDFLVDQIVKGKFGKVLVVYPRPISLLIQRPEVIPLLPCTELFQKPEKPVNDKKPVIVESSLGDIIKYLVGLWITYRLHDLFEESKLAELAARTTHLEQSHNRLTEQEKILKQRYFRCRREIIDRGIRETFSAILLQRSL